MRYASSFDSVTAVYAGVEKILVKSSEEGQGTPTNQGNIEGYHDLWQMSCDQGFTSQQLEDLSWQAWYGPVNADGYTAMDVSHGYSATDTSFIEPASSAGSCSMISDQSGESYL